MTTNEKNMTTKSDRLLYSRVEAAEMLGVHLNTIVNLINRGELHPRCVGSRVMFTRQELERFAGVSA